MEHATPEPLWSPNERRRSETRLTAFERFLGDRGHGPFDAFAALHWFSVDENEAFWDAIWDFAEIIGDKGERIVEPAARMQDTRFFPDARLNVAENVLRPDEDPEALLIVGADERGLTSRLTRGQLVERVGRMQQLLRSHDIGLGDTVAVWLPNVVESYVVMLAAAGLGAVVVTTSPDFGVDGVLDRFSQVDPRLLIAANGYTYGGRDFDCLERLVTIVEALPTLQAVFVHDLIDEPAEVALPEIAAPLTTALEGVEAAEPTFERLPFDHPLYVLFSSGTTGKPKSMVHRAGGVLLTHMKEQQLMCDIRPGDRVFYFTTTGWMMWNWLASVMANRATIVVYDGNPAHPSITRLFGLVDDVGVTFFGTSAKFIESLLKADVGIRDRHGLATIRSVASTGSPLSDEGFAFVYSGIRDDVHLLSMSGGTDLCGCLVGGDPNGPVYSGQIQRPVLGIAVDVFDDAGRSVGPGVQGELVCTAPFPSMPLTFLGDDGDARYSSAYFERYENVWHQGDFAEWTPEGGLVIHGRSDATLNPGGIRIGTAEIYAQVEKIDDVLESLVIGQSIEADTRVVLFVRMREGVPLTEELADTIRRTIRAGATPRHVPAIVLPVEDLPRTRSGKLAEIAVREVVHGRPVKNEAALANPEALALFEALPELQAH
ncbi:MAG: acetoacetate--CoA ligase [Actinomycetota bacterium]